MEMTPQQEYEKINRMSAAITEIWNYIEGNENFSNGYGRSLMFLSSEMTQRWSEVIKTGEVICVH